MSHIVWIDYYSQDILYLIIPIGDIFVVQTNDIQQRADRLLTSTIRVFHHPSFDELKQKKNILANMPDFDIFQKDNNKVQKLQARNSAPEMRPCYEAPLLSFEQEQHLFRKMNYFKYQAKKLIDGINSNRVSEKRIKSIEEHLRAAAVIRNEIAESNFRLATQILKGQITFYREHSLTDALLSDGYFDVLRAVDYFDWTKGYRFSTYATWVVRKNFFRDSKQKTTHAERFVCLDDTSAEMLNSRGEGYEQEREYTDRQEFVKTLLNLLSESADGTDRSRQVRVLEHYFGINGNNRQTLQQISKELGVTKERVRQLKEKGLLWIRHKVEELGIEHEYEYEVA